MFVTVKETPAVLWSQLRATKLTTHCLIDRTGHSGGNWRWWEGQGRAAQSMERCVRGVPPGGAAAAAGAGIAAAANAANGEAAAAAGTGGGAAAVKAAEKFTGAGAAKSGCAGLDVGVDGAASAAAVFIFIVFLG